MKKSNFGAIPGVGPSIAHDIEILGFNKVDDLKNQDAEQMYEKLMQLQGTHIDRCVLYVFRCAIYYAEGGSDAKKLKWWNWKDTD